MALSVSPTPPTSRRRAIRTYGKKRPLTSTEDTTPGCTSQKSVPPTLTPTPSTSTSPPPSSPGDSEPSPKAQKRAGILRYFQPAPPPRKSPCTASDGDAAAGSSTGKRTSAPTATQPRRKRRLTIRPDQIAESGALAHVDRQAPAGSTATDAGDTASRSTGRPMAASSIRMRAQLGQQPTGQENVDSARAPKKKRLAAAPVQTTLSLTIGGDAMKECTECNILYNPLHEKDAKFHARYHASQQRKRARESSEADSQGRTRRRGSSCDLD